MASINNGSVGDDDKETMQTVEDDDVELCQSGDSEEFNFSTKTWREDMALVVENRKLYVASNILSLMSPVFTTMFEDHFKGEGPREIELPGKTINDVTEFLRCIYPSIQKLVSAENVKEVLLLADEYDVTKLKKACEDVLVKEATIRSSPEDMCVFLQHAIQFNLVDLKSTCLKRVAAFDRKKFNVAEIKHPLPLEIKTEIKDIRIEQLINTEIELRERQKTLKEQNENLTEFVRYLWVEKGMNVSFSEGDLGILKFSIKHVRKGIRRVSHEVIVTGIKWSILVTTATRNKDNVETLSVYLQASAPKHWQDWSCETLFKIMILNNETNKHYDEVALRHKFTSTSVSYGYADFIELSDVMLGKRYLVDGELTIKVYLLVKDTMSRPYTNTNYMTINQ